MISIAGYNNNQKAPYQKPVTPEYSGLEIPDIDINDDEIPF